MTSVDAVRNFHTKSFDLPNRAVIVGKLGHEMKVDMVENLIVPHPKFVKARQVLTRFHIKSKKLMRTGTGSIGGIIGDFRSGKSIVVESYLQKFQPVQDVDGWRYPAVFVRARKNFDSKELPRQVLRKTKRPPKSNGSASDLTSIAIDRLGMLSNELLVIDDAHKLIAKAATCATLESLIAEAVDTRTCNVLLIGPPVVRDFIRQHDELFERGNFPHAEMEGYPVGTVGGEETYRLFVKAVDDRLPFPKPSGLWDEPFFKQLVKFSRGSIAKTMNLIREAAYLALDDEDAECIEYHHFHTALMDQLGQPEEKDND